MTQPSQSIIQLLIRLWHHISPRRRMQFGLLLSLMLFAAFAEIVSIGAVLPFLGMLTVPTRVFENPLAQPFIKVMGLTDPSQLLLPLSIVFGLAILVAGAMRLLLLWTSTRLSLRSEPILVLMSIAVRYISLMRFMLPAIAAKSLVEYRAKWMG